MGFSVLTQTYIFMKMDMEGVSNLKKRKSKKNLLLGVFALSILGASIVISSYMMGFITVSGSGYDQFGYNYQARLFNGPVDGADRNLDGTYWGDKTYAKDKLVMKWSKAWDEARFKGKPWNCDAWV